MSKLSRANVIEGDDVRLEGDPVAIRMSAMRHRRRGRGWLVGRLAAGFTFLAVGTLLLAGMTSPRPLAFANTSASVLELFGNFNTGSGSSSLSASPTPATTGAGDLLVALIRTRNGTALAPVSTVAELGERCLDPRRQHFAGERR